MSTLICNLPAYKVWVRKEYLTNHKSGHGEFDIALDTFKTIIYNIFNTIR